MPYKRGQNRGNITRQVKKTKRKLGRLSRLLKLVKLHHLNERTVSVYERTDVLSRHKGRNCKLILLYNFSSDNSSNEKMVVGETFSSDDHPSSTSDEGRETDSTRDNLCDLILL